MFRCSVYIQLLSNTLNPIVICNIMIKTLVPRHRVIYIYIYIYIYFILVVYLSIYLFLNDDFSTRSKYPRQVKEITSRGKLIYVLGNHDDVIKWKRFPRYWPFVRGIHRSPVNSPHKGQWRGALMFALIRVWINGWVNNREAGDLRRHRAHYDVIVMSTYISALCTPILIRSGDYAKFPPQPPSSLVSCGTEWPNFIQG